MQQAIQHGGDGGAVAQQFSPVLVFRGQQRARGFNNYFSLRILAGIASTDNDLRDPGRDVRDFLEKRGLFNPTLKR